CSQKVELVSGDYYEQELKFQGQIERVRRTERLGVEVFVGYDSSKRAITVTVPANQSQHPLTGHIQLYRPSAARLDQELPLQLNGEGRQSFDASHLRPGLWKVRVSWTAAGEDYFIEKKLVVGS